MGVYSKDSMFVSDPIELSQNEVSPRSFLSADETVLFVNSYVYASIVILSGREGIEQVC